MDSRHLWSTHSRKSGYHDNQQKSIDVCKIQNSADTYLVKIKEFHGDNSLSCFGFVRDVVAEG